MNPTPTPVRMRDVAARAGVTASTVSLCLKASPLISAATRERVLSVANELGYRPNPLVRALMKSRRRRGGAPGGPTLAFVTAFPARDGWRKLGTLVFPQMYEGAKARAAECGYGLQEFWLTEPGMSPQRFAGMLHARGILGLIVAPLPNANVSLEFPWDEFAAVALGTTLHRPALHRVANDLFHSMMIAMEECHRLGYRRIGLALRSTVNQKVQRRWLAGYLLAQSELPGLAIVPPLLAEPLSEEAFVPWFRREKPDVVIATAPHDIRQWITSLGRRIPDDVGLVSLSAPQLGDPMSGIFQHAAELGVRSVDLLVTLLERNELGVPALPVSMLVDGVWNPGATVAMRATPRRRGKIEALRAR